MAIFYTQLTGAIGVIVTLAIGYTPAYRDYYSIGLCFFGTPGIQRACILDLGGGMMSMMLGVLLLLIELASAYINQKDVSNSSGDIVAIVTNHVAT